MQAMFLSKYLHLSCVLIAIDPTSNVAVLYLAQRDNECAVNIASVAKWLKRSPLLQEYTPNDRLLHASTLKK